ncbi:MAG TPA: glycosyltransferase family 4 protein [Gammaproteobacteria bacterium]|nr:glycosyltransferase family 4 protein [Gammaproteobacteria bacterium]
MSARPIKTLCITEDPDRPTAATFVGLHAAGVDVTVVCPPGRARTMLAEAGVRLLDLPLSGGRDRAGRAALRAELEGGRYDILHVFGNRGVQNGLAAARGLPVKIVAYRGIVGNVSFLSPVSWLRFLNPRIDRIVCVCNAVRDHFLSMRPAFLRMPASRPVTIYKGHSLDWYTAAPADLRSVGVPEGAFTIACVANYRPRKGIEVLVDAMASLPDDVQLLLIGHMDAPALAARIAASPAVDRIRRLGHRQDAPALTAACDAFVLPSIKREGLARSLIEAMAYGVAPVVTDCGGSPELVLDGECGLVVPVRDSAALARALGGLRADPAQRRRLGAAARERIARHFRIEDTISRTLALYRGLVAERPGEAGTAAST